MSKLNLFVFIDALGFEISQQYPFLDDVLRLKAPLDTVFGYSSTCDPTIITGLMPRDHGHFSFYQFNPTDSPFGRFRWLSLLPSNIADRGRVRHWISKWVKRRLGYTGYFQLYAMPFDLLPYFDYSEKRDLYQPGGINSGARTIFDILRDQGTPFYLSDWRAGETENLESLHRAIDVGEVGFGYVYLAAMDAILHQHGTSAPQVAEKMAWYDRQLREVLDHAHAGYDDVELHVFSDHGMTDVHATLPLMDMVHGLGLDFGRDYAAVFDSTMARFWFLNRRAEEVLRGFLATIAEGRILSDEQLAGWGADFPNREYGELFFLLNPGVLLVPGHLGIKPLAGMHGYEPEDKDSVAFYGTTHPAERNPSRLDELFSIMEARV